MGGFREPRECVGRDGDIRQRVTSADRIEGNEVQHGEATPGCDLEGVSGEAIQGEPEEFEDHTKIGARGVPLQTADGAAGG